MGLEPPQFNEYCPYMRTRWVMVHWAGFGCGSNGGTWLLQRSSPADWGSLQPLFGFARTRQLPTALLCLRANLSLVN